MDNSPVPRDIGEQCVFFIESNDYSERAIRKMRQLRNDPGLWWRDRIGTDTYGTKQGPAAIPLLQVADLGAFLSAKAVAKASQGKIAWWPYLKKLTDGRRVFGITHGDERSLKILYAVHRTLETGDTDLIAALDKEFGQGAQFAWVFCASFIAPPVHPPWQTPQMFR